MSEEINILDYTKITHKWRKFIISFTAASVIATVFICLFTPWTYRAKTTILMPQQGVKGIESIMAVTSLMAGSQINMPVDMGQSMMGRSTNYSDILKSDTLASMICDGLNLKRYFKGRSKDRLISMVKKKLKIREIKGLLTIYAEDRDPRMAADIANYAVIALDEFNKKGNMQYARRLKIFLVGQLASAKVDLADAEENLKKFETQSQMVKLSQKELMLARLMRDVKIKEALYSMLLQEYEKAKIEEAKEDLFFEVLDPAKPPKGPYAPKTLLYSLISVIMGSFIAVFLAFFFEYLESLGVKIFQIDYNMEIKWLNKKI